MHCVCAHGLIRVSYGHNFRTSSDVLCLTLLVCVHGLIRVSYGHNFRTSSDVLCLTLFVCAHNRVGLHWCRLSYTQLGWHK